MQTALPAQRSWTCIWTVWILERLTPLCLGSCLAILCHVVSSDWWCGSGSSSWRSIGRPIAIEQSGGYSRFVDLDLCLRSDSSSVPHILVESAEAAFSMASMV